MAEASVEAVFQGAQLQQHARRRLGVLLLPVKQMQVLQKRELAHILHCHSNPNSYKATGRIGVARKTGDSIRRTALLREAPARSISPPPLRKLPESDTSGADKGQTDMMNKQQLFLAKVCWVFAAVVLGFAVDVQQQQQQQRSCVEAMLLTLLIYRGSSVHDYLCVFGGQGLNNRHYALEHVCLL